MKRQFATLAIAGGLLGGLFVAPGASAQPQAAPTAVSPAASSVAWGPCESEALKEAGAECGFVKVPMDYSKPNGKKISLAVSRVKAKVPANKYQGVMLVNPGGPGGSGLDYATLGANVPKKAGEAYDWIGFDPRGVGASKPNLSCIKNYADWDRPPYVPKTKALERIWLQRSESYANACGASGGELLNHMKTTDSVRDMESIRKALGQQQINYYGFSYGTYLAQVYTTMFPQKMRRMVLDANVNPNKVWYEANLDQDVAFERNINIWFEWLAKHDDVYGLGSSRAEVSETFYKVRDRLDRKAAGGLIGGDEWTDLYLSTAYSKSLYPSLGKLFSDYVKTKNFKPLRDEYAPNVADDNSYAVYNAVQCTDVQWPQKFSKWRKDNWRVHAIAPFETWANAWYNAPCLFWNAKPGTPTKVDGSKIKNGLLISGTKDAATPYSGTLAVRKLYPNTSLIALRGETTHAPSLRGQACTDNRVADYLLTGKQPPRVPGNGADVVCEALPDPAPSEAAAAAGQRELQAANRAVAPMRVTVN